MDGEKERSRRERVGAFAGERVCVSSVCREGEWEGVGRERVFTN